MATHRAHTEAISGMQGFGGEQERVCAHMLCKHMLDARAGHTVTAVHSAWQPAAEDVTRLVSMRLGICARGTSENCNARVRAVIRVVLESVL